MTTAEFLNLLRRKNIRLWVESETLHYNAPVGAMTPELAGELTRRKVELMRLLRHQLEAVPMTINRRTGDGTLPLSFSQQRLWFLDQLETESSLYNVPRALRLNGTLNLEALRKALEAIVERHEILRTNIVASGGVPIQVIAKNRSVQLRVIDLDQRPDGDRQAAMHDLLRSEASRPFNLSADLMLRAMVVRLAENDHVLLLVMHHIASDGWSISILLDELSALYGAFCENRPSPLVDLPIQYGDFALWQRQWLRGERLETQLSYWKKQLSGITSLELATDKPRPVIQTFRGARQSLELPRNLFDALRAVSLQERVTPFMMFLAVFQTLLHRYTGQQDISVGSPIANRTMPEIEGLIGFFVNTLVLRTNFSDNPKFTDLLARVRKVALDAYEHQDLPFEKLVEELNPDRNLSRSPLFQVMLVYQNTPRTVISLPGLTASAVELAMDTEKFDLTLTIVEQAESHKAVLQYNIDLFDEATISRLLNHYQSLLQTVVEKPDRRLSDLPMLTESERRQALIEWNKTQQDYPSKKCIHELFEAQAERSLDATAVIAEGETVPYRELNLRVNRLARYLQKLGVGPEVLVGIYLERSLEMVVSLLAVLKAGGAYVPLDPNYPEERLVLLLQDCRPQVLISRRSLLGKLPLVQTRVVCLDENRAAIASESHDNPAPSSTAENLAYVIYTSGSTGRPKGVAIAHRSAVALLDWAQSLFTDEELGGVLASTSICFDLSVFELFAPLVSGGKVILCQNVLELPTVARIADVRLVNTVPSAMRELLQAGGVPGSVRTVNLAGEPLRPSLVKQVCELANVERLFDLYGPTEDTVYSTFALRNISDPATIGRPIANTQTYILDPYLNPVPVGVAGELYIGGCGLARGYLNCFDLTAEKFIPNPFSDELGARLYRTGDLARYFRDGNIEILGRTDQQVKIRGFRIEPGEIEALLSRHPHVRDSVIVAREDDPEQRRLVAYVVPRPESVCTPGELRNFLKSNLPEHMIPSAFVFLDRLPLTPNGKVNRKILPAPDQSRPDLKEPLVAPGTPAERKIAEIWAEILQLQEIGVHDNFFELGGHSLMAVQVLSRIHKILHVEISLRTLFENPTVAGLATQIASKQNSNASSGEMLKMLADVESLSDEEVEGLLAEEVRKTFP